MSYNNFQSIRLHRNPPKMGASDTQYSDSFCITHPDSVYGIIFQLTGTRGGGNVTIQIQQSPTPGATAVWTDIGAAVLFGAGGVPGTPVDAAATVALFPAANTTLYPVLRIKFTTAAVTEATFNTITRSVRGLN